MSHFLNGVAALFFTAAVVLSLLWLIGHESFKSVALCAVTLGLCSFAMGRALKR